MVMYLLRHNVNLVKVLLNNHVTRATTDILIFIFILFVE